MSMRYNICHIFCAVLVLAGLSACDGKEAQPVQYKAPEVEFTMPSDVINTNVGEVVTFTARVVSGDKVSSGWYIDEVLTSSSQTFDHVFEEPGTYSVRFEARNGSGVVSHSYSVMVSDKLSIKLSVGDSTVVTRLQLNYLKVAAIVEYGKNVEHEWRVDGVVKGNEAYFGTLKLEEARTYEIRYHGSNTKGSFDKTFQVAVNERPLEISFSNTDEIIAILAGYKLSITATVLYGGTGLQQKWLIDDVQVGDTGELSYVFQEGGEYQLSYQAVNAKGEQVSRSWKVTVTSTIRLFDDFEAGTIGTWFNTGENQPGIEIVDNPDNSGINTSKYCLRDRVNGSGGTSGYFTMKGPKMLSDAQFDISEYSGIRFMVHLGGNKYYPRVDYGGTKYPSVNPPKFNGQWEILEYKLPEGTTFDNTKNIVFRMMYTEEGKNISGGSFDDPSNSRTVYIDNIEFFK